MHSCSQHHSKLSNLSLRVFCIYYTLWMNLHCTSKACVESEVLVHEVQGARFKAWPSKHGPGGRSAFASTLFETPLSSSTGYRRPSPWGAGPRELSSRRRPERCCAALALQSVVCAATNMILPYMLLFWRVSAAAMKQGRRPSCACCCLALGVHDAHRHGLPASACCLSQEDSWYGRWAQAQDPPP